MFSHLNSPGAVNVHSVYLDERVSWLFWSSCFFLGAGRTVCGGAGRTLMLWALLRQCLVLTTLCSDISKDWNFQTRERFSRSSLCCQRREWWGSEEKVCRKYRCCWAHLTIDDVFTDPYRLSVICTTRKMLLTTSTALLSVARGETLQDYVWSWLSSVWSPWFSELDFHHSSNH